ncbi:MAG: DUF721 domain-containing protein [Rhodobacteraceae bacterium]|nr:MAG: DUF721 domain-containing protein [Paracoccaceae bacterium]
MAGQDGAAAGGRKPWRPRGFTRLSVAAAPAVGGAGARRGIAESRLIADWATIVGADLAQFVRPVKISHGGRGGLGATLVVAADGARAAEAQHLAGVIVEKVNQVYGYAAVSRLRVVQTGDAAPQGLAEPATGWDGPPPMDAPPSAVVSRVADEDLRAALARLEANIRRKAAAGAAEKPGDA